MSGDLSNRFSGWISSYGKADAEKSFTMDYSKGDEVGKGNRIEFRGKSKTLLRTYLVSFIFFRSFQKFVCTNGGIAIYLLNGETLKVESYIANDDTKYDCDIGLNTEDVLIDEGIFHNDDVNHILVWDEEEGIFITASDDFSSKVFQIKKIKPYFSFVKTLMMFNVEVDRLLRLNSDHIAIFLDNGEISIVSYSKNEKIKQLKTRSLGWWSRPILSKQYPYSYYINLSDDTDVSLCSPIILINYETDEEREFRDCLDNVRFDCGRCLEIYSNHNDEEILIVGTKDRQILFFNTDPKYENENLIKRMILSLDVECCGSIKIISSKFSRYLAFGSMSGMVGLIDISSKNCDDFKMSVISDLTGISDCIYDLQVVSLSSNIVSLAIGAYNSSLILYEFRNLQLRAFEGEQQREDLSERIQFLRGIDDDDGRLFYPDSQKCTMDVRIGKDSSEYCFLKFFFLC